MRRVNLERLEFEYPDERPPGYRRGAARVGKLLGATALGASVYELPEGQSICPYHYEHGSEEWLVVLAGRPTLRHAEGEDVLEPGDVVCFPEGPEGAHKVTNAGPETARVLLLSDMRDPVVAVYPDSDKIGVYTSADDDSLLVRKESAVDYWDGEG